MDWTTSEIWLGSDTDPVETFSSQILPTLSTSSTCIFRLYTELPFFKTQLESPITLVRMDLFHGTCQLTSTPPTSTSLLLLNMEVSPSKIHSNVSDCFRSRYQFLLQRDISQIFYTISMTRRSTRLKSTDSEESGLFNSPAHQDCVWLMSTLPVELKCTPSSPCLTQSVEHSTH